MVDAPSDRCYIFGMITITGKYNSADVYVNGYEDLGESCYAQILAYVNSAASKGGRIAIMPDTHAGVGCVIGFTQKITDRVVPNLVGVDIGCAMLVQKLQPDVQIDLKNLDKIIHRDIPSGMAHRKKLHKFHKNVDLDDLVANVNRDKLLFSVGSLGGGNHFIELDVDSDGYKYIVIHSGSRHLGTEVAQYHQDRAFKHQSTLIKEEHERIVKQCTESGHKDDIEAELKKFNSEYDNVPRHLSYLTGSLMEDYLHDMRIAQNFAWWNREAMLDVIDTGLGIKRGDIVEKFCTVHNYIDLDEMIIRKGAISLKKDEIAIIPMNMRDGSLIVKGFGNEEVNCSGPHGAGRLMSRSDAKQRLTMDEFKKSMEGIYTTSVSTATLDEAPGAYKPVDAILANLGPMGEVINTIKPIYNFKAGE